MESAYELRVSSWVLSLCSLACSSSYALSLPSCTCQQHTKSSMLQACMHRTCSINHLQVLLYTYVLDLSFFVVLYQVGGLGFSQTSIIIQLYLYNCSLNILFLIVQKKFENLSNYYTALFLPNSDVFMNIQVNFLVFEFGRKGLPFEHILSLLQNLFIKNGSEFNFPPSLTYEMYGRKMMKFSSV